LLLARPAVSARPAPFFVRSAHPLPRWNPHALSELVDCGAGIIAGDRAAHKAPFDLHLSAEQMSDARAGW